MASNPMSNGNVHLNGGMPKSSSSHMLTTPPVKQLSLDSAMQNGYRMSPKVGKTPTKAEIDYHLENFIMSRKIALNGGNELRIDDKNISLHLNNPFATPFAAQQHQQYLLQQQQQILYNKGLNESYSDASLPRPKRPHSIAVSSPLNHGNDLKSTIYAQPSTLFSTSANMTNSSAAGIVSHNSRAKITPLNFSQYSHLNGSSSNSPSRNQFHQQQIKKEFPFYTPPSPLVAQSNGQQVPQLSQLTQMPQITQHSQITQPPTPPVVPQRRSQSIPRQSFSTNMTPIVSGVQTLNRPRSLDRYNNQPQTQQTPPNRRLSQGGTLTNGSGMRQSATFHGQPMIQAGQLSYSTSTESVSEETGAKRKDRPVSYAYGTVPEQVYLENQLRIYSEQLKTITESVKKYSEQARLLNELKRQQLKSTVPTSKSDSKISQKLSTMPENDAKTPSHQLRLFLDNIRSSIKDPSAESDAESEADDINKDDKIVEEEEPEVKSNVEPKTPSDQLRQFLDAIRSNQVPETPKPPTTVPYRPKLSDLQHLNLNKTTTDSFSQVTDNIKSMNQDLEMFNKSIDHHSLSNASRNMDQILDNFNQMASLLKTNNSIDYLRKCSEALKQTTDQMRLCNAANGNYSSDDSSCSTTPGSIREAVQNLLAQPRNGFQIMDDRMAIFIDIMEQQGRFSQVNNI